MSFRQVLLATGFVGLALLASSTIRAQDLATKPAPPTAAQLEFFERRVRPIFEERCAKCHASTLAKPKGHLVLDSREGWMKGGETGEVIVPGDVEKSRLITAVRYADLDLQMPPSSKLPDDEIAALESWVKDGAPDPRETPTATSSAPSSGLPPPPRAEDHWAFKPNSNPTPPDVRDAKWATNAIDRFVLARLQAAGFTPAPPASKLDLLERATEDLTGLPPTEDEIDSFERDDAPNAFERVLDRLLASPHYGERQARSWLDLARYADSNGLDENLSMSEAWRYRDWVVRAFNRDEPYDRFVTEQLAGDLLPKPDDDAAYRDQLTATGFLVLGPKMLAEQDKPKLVMDIVDEQLDVAGKAFLGVTLGCARCHDHKFDPIPQKDYYALAGIFKSTSTMDNLGFVSRWRERELATPEAIAAFEAYQKSLNDADRELADVSKSAQSSLEKDWHAKFAAYLLAGTHAAHRATFIEAEEFSRSNLAVDHEKWGTADFGILHTKEAGTQFVEYDVTFETARKLELNVRCASAEKRPMRVLVNDKLVAENVLGDVTGSFFLDAQRWFDVGTFEFQPGRNVLRLENATDVPHLQKLALAPPAEHGDWFVEENAFADGLEPELVRNFAAFLEKSEKKRSAVFAVWHRFANLAPAEFAARSKEVVAALRDEIAAKKLELSPRVAALLDGLAPTSLEDLAGRYQTLFSLVDLDWKAALAKEGEKPDKLADADEEALRQVLDGAAGPFALPKQTLENFYPEATRSEIAAKRAHHDELAKNAPKPFDRALGVKDGELVDLPIHIRGSHLNLAKEPISRGVPSFVAHCLASPEIPKDHSGRLEFARWIVDPKNPLPARVMVNRLWAQHFGVGIVATTSNFGVRGIEPTDPELLDWLAHEFVERGWSIKALHKLIMSSSAYRMSTKLDERAAELDPANQKLWRQNRRRLDAESLRDAWLAASGRIDLALGGTLFTTKDGEYATNDQSADVARYQSTRRSLYLPIIRNAMYGFYATFDYNDPSVPIDQRSETTAAPQALFLMNSPLVIESARALAELAAKTDPDDERARLEFVWRRTLGRAPSSSERERALEFLRTLQSEPPESVDPAVPTAGQSTAAPAKPAATDEKTMKADAEPKLDRNRLAWSALCQTLLVSNEFLYLD